MWKEIKNYRRLIFTMGILDTLAWVFFAIAVGKNELAVTTAITESYPAISLLLGVAVNKEKISRHQLLGGSIAVVASFLMGLIG